MQKQQQRTQAPRQNSAAGVPLRDDSPAWSERQEDYSPYADYPLPPEYVAAPKHSGLRTVLIVLLCLLLVAGGVVGAYFVLSMRGGDSEPSSVSAEKRTAEDEDPAAAPAAADPEKTPEPTPAAVPLLEQMRYVGSAEACAMTAQQATAFANVIRATQGSIIYAAIFDGGSGVPILWVARGGSETYDLHEGTTLYAPFGDKLYSCINGQTQELPWMTTLLRAGTDGVMVKTSKDSSKLQFFYLHNGAPDANPFGVGVLSVEGGGSYNGTYLGPFDQVGRETFYQQAGTEGITLLEAVTGMTDSLMLTGPWIDGAQMAALLEQYAAALS